MEFLRNWLAEVVALMMAGTIGAVGLAIKSAIAAGKLTEKLDHLDESVSEIKELLTDHIKKSSDNTRDLHNKIDDFEKEIAKELNTNSTRIGYLEGINEGRK